MSLVKLIETKKFVVISKKQCPNCKKLKELLDAKKLAYEYILLEDYMELFDDDDFIFDDIEHLKKKWNITAYPMTFIDNEFIGTYSEIQKMNSFDTFNNILKSKGIPFEDNEDF